MKSRDGFFDTDLIARIARMELTARRIVDGFLAGKNRSSRHGFSVEFVEHREYTPGDDLRHLDWKVLGRMDRYYIKRYEEETNITAVLLLDCSASMTYASAKLEKFAAAATVSSALGHLLTRQRDALGLAIFDDSLREYVAPSARLSSLANIVARLKGTEPRGKSSLAPLLDRLVPELPGRCLLVLLSDLLLPVGEIKSAFRQLHSRGHDVLVLQVLDPAEISFPFRRNTLFRGLEDERKLLAEPQRLRTQYLAALEAHLAALRKACESCAFDYRKLSTGDPLAPALTALLAARRRRRPARTGHGG